MFKGPLPTFPSLGSIEGSKRMSISSNTLMELQYLPMDVRGQFHQLFLSFGIATPSSPLTMVFQYRRIVYTITLPDFMQNKEGRSSAVHKSSAKSNLVSEPAVVTLLRYTNRSKPPALSPLMQMRRVRWFVKLETLAMLVFLKSEPFIQVL